MATMRSQLQTIATEKNWNFKHGRSDYLHLDEDDANNPLNMQDGETWLILDPVETTDETGHEGTTEGETYRGQLMILFKSDLEGNYDSKTTNYIDPAKAVSKELKQALTDKCLMIETWRVIDGLNMLFENADGVVITYQVKNEFPQ